MLKQFCAGQNIRALMTGPVHEALQSLQTVFVEVFQGDNRGTLLNDICAFEDARKLQFKNHKVTTALDDETYRLLQHKLHSNASARPWALLQRKALIQASISRLGVKFSTFENAPGDSYIIFGDLSNGLWSAGRISQIFVWGSSDSPEHQSALFLTRKYVALNAADSKFDCYSKLSVGAFTGRLFYREFEDTPVLLGIDDIVCHFASTPVSLAKIQRKCVHVLPLDR